MNTMDKLNAQVPFLRIFFPFAFGILIAHYFLVPAFIAWILAALASGLAYFCSYRSNSTRLCILTKGYFVSIALLFIGVGVTNHWNSCKYDPNFTQIDWYTGVVTDHSPIKNNRQKYIVDVDGGTNQDGYVSIKERIVLVLKDSDHTASIAPGTRIAFDEKPSEIAPPANPGEFDYKRFMDLKAIRYQLYCRKPVSISPLSEHTFRTRLLVFRTRLLERLEAQIQSDNEFGVIAALTLGEKDFLTEEIKTGYATTGAMHVLAVSGLHVGIIYMILNLLLKPLSRNTRFRVLKPVLALVFLWTYAFITGLPASVFRATTMFSFIVVGEGLKRKPNTYNSVITSAMVLLLFNPNILFEVGFQLSYLAVLSIIFFQPRLAELYKPKNKAINWAWQLFTVSIAAQLGTSPIGIYYFNQFPTYFWISNFLVIPMAGFILYTTFAYFLLSFFAPLSTLIAWVLRTMVWILNTGISKIENLSGSLIEGLYINSLDVLLYYVLLFSISFVLIFRFKKGIVVALASMLGLLVGNTFQAIETQTQQLIVVHKTSRNPLISFVNGREHAYYFGGDTLSNYEENILRNTEKSFKTSKSVKINDLETLPFPWLASCDENIVFQGVDFSLNTRKSYKLRNYADFVTHYGNYQISGTMKLNDNSIKLFQSYAPNLQVPPDTLKHQFQKDGALLVLF